MKLVKTLGKLVKGKQFFKAYMFGDGKPIHTNSVSSNTNMSEFEKLLMK